MVHILKNVLASGMECQFRHVTLAYHDVCIWIKSSQATRCVRFCEIIKPCMFVSVLHKSPIRFCVMDLGKAPKTGLPVAALTLICIFKDSSVIFSLFFSQDTSRGEDGEHELHIGGDCFHQLRRLQRELFDLWHMSLWVFIINFCTFDTCCARMSSPFYKLELLFHQFLNILFFSTFIISYLSCSFISYNYIKLKTVGSVN